MWSGGQNRSWGDRDRRARLRPVSPGRQRDAYDRDHERGTASDADNSAAFQVRSNLATIREGIIETAAADAGETRAFETLGRLTRGTLHELANPLVALL